MPQLARSRFASLRERWFGISDEEVSFSRRGFHFKSDELRWHLEHVGRSFLKGYNAALAAGGIEDLHDSLATVENKFRGFSYEGAAMALALLDHLLPARRRRFRAFLEGPGAPHCYLLYVGYGWTIARLPWLRWNPRRQLVRLDPLLGWLAMDGFGFHEGYFHRLKVYDRRHLPPPLADYMGRAFDQGLGRSMWFAWGGDVDEIAALVHSFRESRRPDLWSGIGLAATYAGSASDDELDKLIREAGPHSDHLAQGAAFAAEARCLAGNEAEHTQRACLVLCGMDAASAALVARETRPSQPGPDLAAPCYESWRKAIRDRVRRSKGVIASKTGSKAKDESKLPCGKREL